MLPPATRFMLTAPSDLSDEDERVAFLGDQRIARDATGRASLVHALGWALPGRLEATPGGSHEALRARAVQREGQLLDVLVDPPRSSPTDDVPFPAALFVYGTLMRGEEREGAIRGVLPNTPPEAASVRGRLVHLGAWPGLVGGAERVHGELYRSERLAELLRVLDPIEDFAGYGAAPREYVRVIARVDSAASTSWAWTYRFVGDASAAVAIPSGRWRDAPRRLPGCSIL